MQSQGLESNHADIFQPLIINHDYTHTLNITRREIEHMDWTARDILQSEIKLYGTKRTYFGNYWRRKVNQPYAFTTRDVESMSREANV